MICPHCEKNKISRVRYLLIGNGYFICPSCGGKSKKDIWMTTRDNIVGTAYALICLIPFILSMIFLPYRYSYIALLISGVLMAVCYPHKLVPVGVHDKESTLLKAFHYFALVLLYIGLPIYLVIIIHLFQTK